MKEITRLEYAERARHVVDLVRSDLDGRLTIETLADRAGFSPFHFQRLFRLVTGETPGDLVRRFRLERAATQLSTTDARIGDVAFDAGYDSHEAFSRAFRTAYGVTAREFRNAKLTTYQLASPVGLHYGGSGGFEPLNRRHPAVSYSVRDVEPFVFSGLKHRGSFQFAHRTWGELFKRLGEESVDPMPYRWINMADELTEQIPVSEIEGWVGMDLAPPDHRPWMLMRTLGGGPHLVAEHVGPANGLVDFWYRLFFECLPHSGRRLRPGPLFQATYGAEAVNRPESFATTVCIPISGDEIAHL